MDGVARLRRGGGSRRGGSDGELLVSAARRFWVADRGRARGIQVVWINLALAHSSSADAVRAATLACGGGRFPHGRWVVSLACLAGCWVAAAAADLESRPDPSWFGYGRPAARDGVGVGRPEVLNRLYDDTIRLHGAGVFGSSQRQDRGGATSGENRADFGHGGRRRRLQRPLLRHHRCKLRQHDQDIPGETLDLGLPDRTMTAPSVSYSLLRASFWSRSWLKGTRRSGVSSNARPTTDPGGMALQSFGDGRVWMDTCRMVVLSGAMVASMAGLTRSVRQYSLWRQIGGRRRRQPR
ncbi:hypothetical protein VPH35_014451 [Triticum aestivum]